MLSHAALTTLHLLGLVVCCMGDSCMADDAAATSPVELEVLKASVGVWDAEIEVWPQGSEAPSITFQGVETNRAYGEHWIASDFDSEFMGQTMKVHSIVGYDLDKKKLVGTVIDHGPYAATMTGDYDPESQTITWMTSGKMPGGQPIVQKTLVKQDGPGKRVLVLMVPGKGAVFTRFMQITFTRRD